MLSCTCVGAEQCRFGTHISMSMGVKAVEDTVRHVGAAQGQAGSQRLPAQLRRTQGLVAGKVVTCPMHSWKIQLESGADVAPDTGCAESFAVKLEAGTVWIAL